MTPTNPSHNKQMTDEELDQFLDTFWEDIENTDEEDDCVSFDDSENWGDK